jgi:hypothetical protein
MTKNRLLFTQILLFAIVGMGAALLVWAAMIWPVCGIWDNAWESRLSATILRNVKFKTILLLYLPLGLVLGAAVTMIQPIWDTSLFRAIKNEWRWLLLGSVLGGAGAGLGGLAGEYVLNELGPAVGHIIGGLIMGLVLGIVLGIAERWRTGSQERLVAGVVGGALGGVLSGVFFNYVPRSSTFASAVSMMVFAALVAGAIGAVAFLQTRARLVGTPDNGRKYDNWQRELLGDATNLIGSALSGSQKATMKLYDQSILPEHAVINYDRGTGVWRISRYNANVRDLFVNGERLAGEARPLQTGDIIRIGKRLEFRFEVER